MILEMRVYHCLPGRLPSLLERFRNGALDLLAKHNFRPVGFFTTMIGGSHQELTYFLEWKSLDELERCWKQYFADPAWHELKAQSEKDGFIVDNTSSKIVVPTDFSPMR